MDDLAYPVVVEPLSKEDGGGYLAVVPDLPGCIGDGETPEEAVADVRSGVLEWIDEARRLKRQVPAPHSMGKAMRDARHSLADFANKYLQHVDAKALNVEDLVQLVRLVQSAKLEWGDPADLLGRAHVADYANSRRKHLTSH